MRGHKRDSLPRWVVLAAVSVALLCHVSWIGGANALPVKQVGLEPNQPPRIALPPAPAAVSGTAITLAGVHVSDPDVAQDFDGVLTVVVEPTSGGQVLLASSAGLTVFVPANVWAASVTLVGTAASVNTALSRLRYRSAPAFAGTELVSITVDDAGFTGTGGPLTAVAMLAVDVATASTPPAPSFGGVGVVSAVEDQAVMLGASATGMRDGDATVYRAIATVDVGRLSFDAAPDGVVVAVDPVSGTASLTGLGDALAAGLAAATYTPASDWNSVLNGFDDVRVCVAPADAPASSLCTAVAVDVSAVNDAPVLAVPGAVAHGVVSQEDGKVVVAGVSVSDVDVAEAFGGVLHAVVSCNHGTVEVGSGVGLLFDAGNAAGSPTPTLGFTGAPAAVNAALGSFSYRPGPGYTGDDAITVAVADVGYTGEGPDGGLSDTATIPVTVTAHNDAPTIEAPAEVATVEDVAVSVPGVVVADRDADKDPVRVTLSVAHGRLALGELSYWLSFQQGDGTGAGEGGGDATIEVTGPLLDMNKALEGLVYTPRLNHNARGSAAADVLAIHVNDLGHNGGGGEAVAEASVPIRIAPVNDGPTLAAPAAVTAAEDEAVAVTGITVDDVDVSEDVAGALRVSLSAPKGSLAVTTAGLWLTEGVRAGPPDRRGLQWFSGPVEARGALANVQAMLASLHYRGAVDWSGTDAVSIAISDDGGFGNGGELTASATVDVTVTPVNDAPALELPAEATSGGYTTNEDTAVTIDGTSIADVDLPKPSHLVTVSLTVAHGGSVALATAQGIRFDGAGPSVGSGPVTASSLTFTGTLADVNAAVAVITYTPAANWNGMDSVEVLVNDGGGGGSGGSKVAVASVPITVLPVNDAPTVSGPATAVDVDSTKSAAVPGVSIADVDFASAVGATVTVTITAEGGGAVSVAHSRQLPVPAFPVQAGVTAAAVFSAGGAGVAAAATELKFVAPLAEANDLLSQLSYHAPFSAQSLGVGGDAGAASGGAFSVRVTASDGGSTGPPGPLTGTKAVPMRVRFVNRPPTVVGPADVTATEDVPMALEGLAVADPDSGTHAIKLTLAVAHGAVMVKPADGVEVAGGKTAGAPAAGADLERWSSVTLRGNVAALDAALGGVFYLSAADWNSPLNGADTVTVTADDGGFTGAGTGGLSASTSVRVWVMAVNDAPVLTVPAAGDVGNVMEDSEAVVRGVSLSDVDVAETVDAVVEVTLAVSHGLVALSTDAGVHVVAGEAVAGTKPTVGAGARPLAASWTVRGSVRAVNRALSYLRYRPDADFWGDDELEVSVSDLGATGASDAMSAVGTVTLHVVPATDSPVITSVHSASAPLMGLEDTPIALHGVTVEAREAEALAVTLECSHCTLSLPPAVMPGLEDVVPPEQGSRKLSFRGPVDAVQKALPLLTYTGVLNWNSDVFGLDALTVTVDLLAFEVQPVRASAVVYVRVAAVDDAPSVAVPRGGFTAVEDKLLRLEGVLVTDADIDDVGGSLALTLGVSNGWLEFAGGMAGLDVLESNPAERLDDAGSPRTTFRSVTARGSLASVRAALKWLGYRGAKDWSGDDQVSVRVEDTATGAFAEAVADVTVAAVNDPPTIDAPGDAFTIEEDSALSLPFAVGDVDLGTGAVSVTLACERGTMAVRDAVAATKAGDNGGYTVELGASGASVTVRGTLAGVNSALATATYTPLPDFNGFDLVRVVADDGQPEPRGHVLEAVTVRVTPVNDAPTLAIGDGATFRGSQEARVAVAVDLGDVDASELDGASASAPNLVRVVIAVGAGRVALAASDGIRLVSLDGEDDPEAIDCTTVLGAAAAGGASITFDASLSAAAAALRRLVYVSPPQWYGDDVVELGVDDLGNSGSGGAMTADLLVLVHIDRAAPVPAVTAPVAEALSCAEDTALPMEGWGVTLSDAAALDRLITVAVTSWQGTAALSEEAERVVATTVDEGPWPSHSARPLPPGSPEFPPSTATAVLRITGLVDDVNVALSSLVFTPAADFNGLWGAAADDANSNLGRLPPPSGVLAAVGVSACMADPSVAVPGPGGAATACEPGVASSSQFRAVSVDWVNDAPVLSGPSELVVAAGAVAIMPAASVVDVDAGEVPRSRLSVSIRADTGMVSVSEPHVRREGLVFDAGFGAEVVGAPVSELRFTGPLTGVSRAVAAISYHAARAAGSDTVVITVDDNGFSGDGPVGTDSMTVDVAVTAVDRPPAVSVPGTSLMGVEDTDMVVSGTSVADTDLDDEATLQATVSTDRGVLVLGDASAVTVEAGDRRVQALRLTVPRTASVAEEQVVATVAVRQGEVQSVGSSASSPMAGTFRLALGDDVTPRIDVDDDGAAVLAKLRAVPGYGHLVADVTSVVVDGAVGSQLWNVTFLADAGDVPQLRMVDGAMTPGDATVDVNTTQHGSLPSGTFTLGYTGGEAGMDVTMPLPYDATANEVAAAIAALPSVSGDVTVTRSDPDTAGVYTWTITFTGAAAELSGDLHMLVPDASGLVGYARGDASAPIQVTVTQAVAGETPASGTFRLASGDFTTEAIPAAATAQRVAWALSELDSLAGTACDTPVPLCDMASSAVAGASFARAPGSFSHIAVTKSVVVAPAESDDDDDTLHVLWTVSFDACPTGGFAGPWPALALVTEGLVVPDGADAPVTNVVEPASAVVFTGRPADVNAALSGMVFRPAKHWNSDSGGVASVLVTAVSQCSRQRPSCVTGSHTGRVLVHVSAVNDPPVVDACAAYKTSEGHAVTLSGLAVADADVMETPGGRLTATVTVTHGSVELAPSAGVVVVSGVLSADSQAGVLGVRPTSVSLDDARAGAAWRSVTVRGAGEAVARALGGVRYAGAPMWNSATAQLDVQTVRTSAATSEERQAVTLYALSGTIAGTFTLTVNLTSVGGSAGTTDPIFFDAVPLEEDEEADGTGGAAPGESVQAKLRALPALEGITVQVTRSPEDLPGGSTWEVAFWNAPGPVPAMVATSVDLTCGSCASGVPDLGVEVVRTGHVDLGGSFTLAFGGETTDAIAYDASSADVGAALEALVTVAAVSVSRSGPDANQGYVWTVAFNAVGGTVGALPTMTGDASMLTGVGASLAVAKVADGVASPDVVTVTVMDGGGTGSGGEATASLSVPVTVLPVPSAPVMHSTCRAHVGSGDADFTVKEDVSVSLQGLHVADPDAGTLDSTAPGRTITVMLSALHGLWQLSTTEGLALVSRTGGLGDGDFDAARELSFRGTLAAVNAALLNVTYVAAKDYNGWDELTARASVGALSGQPRLCSVLVTPVNDAPWATAPVSVFAATERTTLLQGMALHDVDASESGDQLVRVALAVAHGTVSLPPAARHQFRYLQGSGEGDSAVKLEGAVPELNDALASLTYVAPRGFSQSSDTLSVEVWDLGNTGEGGPMSWAGDFDIHVNPLASMSLLAVRESADYQVEEDGTLVLDAFQVAEGLPAADVVEVMVQAEHGALSFASEPSQDIAVSGTGTADLTLRGPWEHVNDALASVIYGGIPHFNGWDAVTAVVRALGSHGSPSAGAFQTGSALVRVSPVNNPPTLTTATEEAGGFRVAEGESVVLGGLRVADVDIAEDALGLLEVTARVMRGTLALQPANTPFHGVAYSQRTRPDFHVHQVWRSDDGRTLRFAGLPADVTAALGSVVYTGAPASDVDDSYVVRVADQMEASAELTLPISIRAVNTLPVITMRSSWYTTPEDVALPLTGLSVSDPDAGGTALRLRMVAERGSLALVPRVGAAMAVEAMAVDGAGHLTVDASLEEFTLALAEDRLVYLSAPDFNGRDYVHISFVDGGGSGVVLGGGTDGFSATLIVDVTPVNDAPVVSVPAQPLTVVEAGAVAISGTGVAVVDVDANETPGALVSVTITAEGGHLSMVLPQPGLAVTSNGKDGAHGNAVALDGIVSQQRVALGASIVIQGSLGAINAALGGGSSSAGVQYHPPAAPPGGEYTVTVSADDGGATGAMDTAVGAWESAFASFTVVAQPSFDVPRTLIALPGSQPESATYNGAGGDVLLRVAQHVPLHIQGVAVSDPDVGSAAVRLDLAADHGHLRLGLEADVAVDAAASEPVTVAVDESGDVEGTVQPFRRFLGFEASLAAANAALAGLTYVSNDGHTGRDYLRINVTVRPSETDPELSASPVGRVLAIQVEAVNHAPVVGSVGSDMPAAAVEHKWAPVHGVTLSDADAVRQPELLLDVNVTATHGLVRVTAVAGLALLDGCEGVDEVPPSPGFEVRLSCADSGVRQLRLRGAVAPLSAALSSLEFRGDEQWAGVEMLTVSASDGDAPVVTAPVHVRVEAVNDTPVFVLPGAGAGVAAKLVATRNELVADIGVALTDPDPDSDADVVLVRAWSESDDAALQLTDDVTLSLVQQLPAPANQLLLIGQLRHVSDVLGGLRVAHKPLPRTDFSVHSDDVVHFQAYDAAAGPGGEVGGSEPDARALAVADRIRRGELRVEDMTQSASALLPVAVASRNEAPVISAPATPVPVNEDVATVIGGVSVADSDLDSGPSGEGVLEVTITATNGAVSVDRVPGLYLLHAFEFAPVLSSRPHTPLHFRASLAVTNAALATLTYTGKRDYTGPDAIIITANDHGWYAGAAIGEPGEATVSVPVQVQPVNDPPVIAVPPLVAAYTPEDEVLPIYRCEGVQVTDVDIENELVHVELSASHGKLGLAFNDGLLFSHSSDGSNGHLDQSMAFRGLLDAVNLAMHTIRYEPNHNFTGVDTIVITASDGGSSGSGGEGEARRTVPVTVQAVNTPPRIQTPDHVLVALEDEPFSFGDSVGLVDIDSSDTPGGFVEVSARAGHGGVLEVQSVSTWAAHVDMVQVVGVYSAHSVEHLGGSFRLAVDDSEAGGSVLVTAPISPLAAPRVDDEFRGGSTGYGPGESVESALLGLGLPFVTVDVTRQPASSPDNATMAHGFEWRITFANADFAQPALTVYTTALESDDAAVGVRTEQVANSLGGTFTLRLGSHTTVPIDHSVSPAGLKEALEALPNIGTVDVAQGVAHTDRAGTTHDRTREDGRRWMVTFFDPAGDVDVLVANGAALTGVGAGVGVEEVRAGFGVPALYNVSSFATHHDQVQVVRTYAGSPISGYFNLGLDMTFLGGGAGWALSEGIEHDAVPMIEDEAHTHALGTGRGQSMQAKLHQLFEFVAGNSTQGPMRTLIRRMHVTVGRSAVGINGALNWTITFRNAPFDMPLLTATVHDNELRGTGAFAEVVEPRHANGLSGSFRLNVNGDETGQLAHDAPAADVRAALMSLETVHSASTLRLGSVEVARSPRGMQGEYTWVVAFTQENPYLPARLSANANAMRGVGAGADAWLIRSGGQAATLFTVDAIGASAGGVASNDPSQDAVPRFRGSAQDANRVLRSLRYLSARDWHGDVTVAVEVTDHGYSGSGASHTTIETFEVSVAPVNDPPVVNIAPSAVAALRVGEDADLFIRSLQIEDVDAAAGRLQLKVAVTHGRVAVAHDTAIVTGNNTREVTVSGDLGELNSALLTLTYRGDQHWHGTDELRVTMDDAGHTGVTHGAAYPGDDSPTSHIVSRVMHVVVTPVNDQPYVRLAAPRVDVDEDGVVRVAVISVTDVDADEYENTDGALDLTLTATNGHMLLDATAGVTTTGSTSASGRDRKLVLRGSLSRLNEALVALRFTPDRDFFGEASIHIAINDRGNTGAGPALSHSGTVFIDVAPVNDEPVLQLRGGPVDVAEDSQFRVPNTTVVDVDIGTGLLTVTMWSRVGTLTIREVTNQVEFLEGDGDRDERTVFRAPIEDVNLALASLIYRPKINWNSLLNGPDLVRVLVDDGELFDRGLPVEAHPLTVKPGESSTTSLREMVVYVTPVNDQPVLTLPGTEHHPITTQPDFLSTVVIDVATITLDEDTDRFIEGITVRDIDAHEAPDTVVEVSLYCSHGAITLTEGIRAPVYSFIAGTGFQDQAVVFRATVPNANLALKGLSYRGKLDYFGPDELVVTVSDLGNVGAPPQTGMSPVLAHSLTLPLVIEPVNDSPIVVLPDPHLTAFEDDQLTVLGVRLIDVDSADSNVTVTVEVGLGTFTLTRAIEDIMFTEGNGELDRRVVFTAPLDAANRALDKAVYRPQHDWNSLFRASDWVRITITDNGASGAPPPTGEATLSHSDTFFVAVIPENDPPVWTVPNGTIDYVYDELYEVVHVSTIVVDEDTPLDLQGVSLADVDANEGFGSTLDVKITTQHGQLFLRSLEGLTMLDGSVGHGDAVLRFRGTLANINHALRDLRYVAQLNYHGQDSIVFHANDRGFTGSGNSLSDEVTIPLVIEPVNDRPLWVVPTQAFIVQEEEGTFIEGLSIADVDDYGSNMTVSLTVVQGVLTIPRPDSNVTFLVGDGDRNTDIVISGPKVALNEALSGLSYRPNEHWNTVLNNRDSITMVVRDHGNTGSGGELDNTHVLFIDRVTGVNDPPVIHAPGEVRITDPCEHSPTANRHVRCGSLIQVDSWTVEEDEELAIEGVYVEDLDLEETFGAQIDVAVSCYFCSLTLFSEHGLTFLRGNGTADRVVQFLATLPNANYALRQIRYTGLADYYGPDNVTITVNDQGYTGTGGNLWDEVTIPINVTAVNDQVSWSVPSELPPIKEEEKLTLGGITIADVDALDSLYEVHIRVQRGQLSIVRMVGLSFINETQPGSTEGEEVQLEMDISGKPVTPDSGWVAAQTADAGADLSLLFELEFSGQFGFRGTLEDINTALDSLLYDGKLNFNTQDKDKDVISMYVTDLGSTGAGPPTEDWATMYVTVSPKNDAPVVTVPGATFSTSAERNEDELAARIVGVATITGDEDTVVTITGVRVHDVDLLDGSDGKVTMTLFASFGTLTVFPIDEPAPPDVFFEEGTGVSDRRMQFTGPIEAVNQVLDVIWYLGDQDWSGDDGVSITVSDNGYTGEGGVKTDTQVIPIKILPINDPPVISVPFHDNGTTTLHIVESASKKLGTVMFHQGTAAEPRGVTETGDELWLTRGFRPDVEGQTGMLSDKQDGALGLGESWRLSMVTDLWTGRNSSAPAFLVTYGPYIYFSADNGTTGRELWRSDGTAKGTTLVKDTFPGIRGGDPQFLVVFNGLLYFTANGVDTNWMLRTDECAGFRRSVAQEEVYYAVARDTLWLPHQVYDCPAGWHWASTEEALDLFPYTPLGGFTTYPKQPLDAGFDDFLTIEENASPTYYDQCGWTGFAFEDQERHHFRFSDSHITGALKMSGSPDAGPIIVDNFQREQFAGIVCVSGEHDRCRTGQVPCYLRSGAELWQSDGTDAGTIRVVDVRPGLSGSDPKYMVGFQPPEEASPIMLFAASSNAFGSELWRSDGTAAGTRLVEDINRGAPGSRPRYLTPMGGLVFFAADDGFRGEELWATDGMPTSSGANTYQVFDIQEGPGSAGPQSMCAVGDLLFFRADDGVHGAELWVTQGDANSTRMVADIQIGKGGSEPAHIVAYNGRAFFQADDGLTGAELWVSNGTQEGTFLLFDIEAGFASARPSFLTVFSPRPSIEPVVFFTVISQAGSGYGPGGAELWRSDGTSEGTERAFQMTATEIDVNPSMNWPHPARLVEYHNSLFISAARGRASEVQPIGFLDVSDAGLAPGTLTGLVPQSLSVIDVDGGAGRLLFNLTSRKGFLSLGTTDNLQMVVGSGTLDTEMLFLATLADANFAFRSVIYTGRPLENGEDRIVITVNDTGFTGTYGAVQVSQADVDVWIYEVNDPPLIVAPSELTTLQADALVLSGIELSDPDLASTVLYDAHGQPHEGRVRLTLWTDAGHVSLTTLVGLSFRKGSGIKDTEVQVEGAIGNLNAAVRQLRYVCAEVDECGLGDHFLYYRLEDNGYTGGQPLLDEHTTKITVLFNPAQ